MQSTLFTRVHQNSNIFIFIFSIQPVFFLKNYIDISTPVFILIYTVWLLLLFFGLSKKTKETITISSEGIGYETNSKKERNWRLSWSEINHISFRVSLNKGRHLLIDNNSGTQVITLGFWNIETPIRKKINLKSIFDLSLHHPIPSEEPIYKSIEKFIPINDDQYLLEDIKYGQEALQLGKKAGVLSIISVAFSICAVIAAHVNNCITIENGALSAATIGATSTLGIIALLYIRNNEKPLGTFLTLPIFLATTYWLSWSVLSTTPALFGSKETTTFELTKKFVDHQTWASTKNPKLTLNIYVDMTKIRYFTYHTTKTLTIVKGPLGIICITSQEIKKLIKE